MTCPACSIAERNPRSGQYHIGCPDCGARMLAHAPTYFEATTRNTITKPYRAALATVAKPGETERDTHLRVRVWAHRISQAATHPPATPQSPATGPEKGLPATS